MRLKKPKTESEEKATLAACPADGKSFSASDDANKGADRSGGACGKSVAGSAPAPREARVSAGGITAALLPLLFIIAALLIALFGGEAMKNAGFSVLSRHSFISGAPLFADEEGYEKGRCEVWFFDVGEADCALLRSPDGHCLLIDSGSAETAKKLPGLLKKAGAEKLDYLILTHPHEDHIGGAKAVISSLEVGCLLIPDVGSTLPEWSALLSAAEERSLTVSLLRAPEKRSLGRECAFTVIGPTDTDASLNNCSAVLRFEYGDVSFLFTGDMEAEEEDALLGAYANAPELFDCDVLKAAHHGSSTSSTEAFLNAVSPKLTVISCGRGNPYGHPDYQTLDALEKVGSAVLRTDRNGTVLVQSDKENVYVFCEKNRRDAENASYAAVFPLDKPAEKPYNRKGALSARKKTAKTP